MASLTTLVTFDGGNGSNPSSGLIRDASGNLFGVTGGGQVTGGTVYEIPLTANGYARTVITLASFPFYGTGGTAGTIPSGELTMDAAGDLFGTTEAGGLYGTGVSFEIVKTGAGYNPTPLTLSNSGGSNGQLPPSALAADAAGNLFGATQSGGVGTIFERRKTASGYSAPITLASFDPAQPGQPFAALTVDAAGNLFGTTTNGYLQIFELRKTVTGYASAPLILGVSSNGNGSYGPLLIDAAGNLLGTNLGSKFSSGSVFELSGVPHGGAYTGDDFSGDGDADILWRYADGRTALWKSNGSASVASNANAQDLGVVDTGWQVAGVGDFNGDGKADILWRYTDGRAAIWNSSANAVASNATAQELGLVDPSWTIAAVGDFNGDGLSDILWRNTSGDTAVWTANGYVGAVSAFNGHDLGMVDTSWRIAGVGDFNGDGRADILWRYSNGDTVIWDSSGANALASNATAQNLGVVDPSWQIAGVGDFNGDGLADILWRNANGDTVIWKSTGFSNGALTFSAQDLGLVDTSWQIAGVGDYNGDRLADILWRHTNGDAALWNSTGASSGALTFSAQDLGLVDTGWSIQKT